MFSTKKLLFFIVGIISVVSLFACQKANANQSNVSDTEETQKTVLEMEIIVIQIRLRMDAYFVCLRI